MTPHNNFHYNRVYKLQYLTGEYYFRRLVSKILEPIWLPQSLIYKFKAAINSGQKEDFFWKKDTFLKKGPQNFTTTYSSALHQNKVLYNFGKRGTQKGSRFGSVPIKWWSETIFGLWKNASNLTLKALFVLKIYRFLS